eukprot:UN23236
MESESNTKQIHLENAILQRTRETAPPPGKEKILELAGRLPWVPTRRSKFFGDSFVRLFSLVKNRGLRVRGYKGATAKGLTKVDNSNRKDILKQLRRRPNTTRAVFVFGNVDVQMSYYFCKYARSPPEMIDFDAIAKDYVDFVANLPISEAIVVGVYPSPLVDDEVVASLGNYGILNDDQQATVEAADVLLNARQTRVQYFNSRLALYCAQQGVTYVDLFNEMTDETNALKPQYRDISSRNIHVDD